MNLELLKKEVAKYISDNYEGFSPAGGYFGISEVVYQKQAFGIEAEVDEAIYDLAVPQSDKLSNELDEIVKRKHETFQEMLFRLIDESGKEDTEVYKKANIDRKYFSKIRNGTTPVKNTVIALCLALELNDDQSRDLLEKAGYALSNASKKDLIVEYCIKNKIYDLMVINLLLEEYKESIIR